MTKPTVTILHAQGFVLVTLNVEKAYFKDLLGDFPEGQLEFSNLDF
jgi:hypothetical protein